MKLAVLLLTGLLARDSTQFVFPESKRYEEAISRLLKEKYNEVMVSSSGCPGGEEYCELPLAYPSSKMARALEKVDNSLMRSLLNRTIDTSKIAGELETRTLSEFERVCDTLTEFIKPRQAKTKSGDYMFIVNGGEGLEETVQRVTVTKCRGAGHTCNLDSEEVTECRQDHAEHRLVALDEAGEQLVMENFLFPSGCSCYKKNVFY